MRSPASSRRSAALLLAGLVGALLVVPSAFAVPSPGAPAERGPAVSRGEVTGQVLVPRASRPHLAVRWFTDDYAYLGQRNVGRGLYSLKLAAGTYRLQFVDRRPAYDLEKLAPADIRVTVRANRTTQKDVRLHVGAAVTGTVRTHGRAGGGATVTAAAKDGRSFSVKANAAGQFALGGLPAGSYSLFSFDRKKEWVDKSRYVRGLRLGRVRNVRIDLRQRAGELRTQLYTADGDRMTKPVYVTAVSRVSGQFWTAKSRGGTVIFRGLYPGRYRLVAPAVDGYLARTGPIQGARVRPGRADLVSRFTWIRRGATISGTVVDGVYPATPLFHALVVGYDRYGHELDRALTRADGSYTLGGGLTSQDDIVVEVRPDPTNAPYMQGENYCKFASTEIDGVGVITGQDTALGATALPQLPTAQQDNQSNCGPDHTSP